MSGRNGDYIKTASPFGPLDDDVARIDIDDPPHGFEPEEPARDDLEARRARGWTVRTVIVAALALALLNAHALQSWTTTLPPEWGGQTLRTLADAWYGRTTAAGLDRPRAAVHDAFEAKKTLVWSDLAQAK
jgi:hypothetical protein